MMLHRHIYKLIAIVLFTVSAFSCNPDKLEVEPVNEFLSENFYQIELPLQFTPFNVTSADQIWPDVNEIDIALNDLNKVKSRGIAEQTLNTINYYEIIHQSLALCKVLDYDS